ncbi:MAG: DegT/DnrJ/EryC1/StrS family aminotransferase [Microgenomates group bacterium]
MNNIPLVDLLLQYNSIKTEIDLAIELVIKESAYIGGKYVSLFEKEFAEYIGVKYCIGCANGTDTMEIILKAMGVMEGDEVIIPTHTWISTAEAVSNVGATPVFVDCLDKTYIINVDEIERKITDKTKVIIPVHLYGTPVDMDKVMSLAKRYSLKVLEDCAQAHGAEFHGQKVGSLGDAASFSFYPGKNLGAYGDAGAVLTNNYVLAEKVRMIANHGQKEKHTHLVVGRNSRLDGMQAAILSVKLKHLDTWNTERRKKAELYKKLLSGSEYILPLDLEGRTPVYHVFAVQCKNREKVIEILNKNGIQSAIHYPNILPATDIYRESEVENKYPVSSYYIKNILSLPIYAELTDEDISRIVTILLNK